MERYEINKYLQSFNQKVNDLKEALAYQKKSESLKALEEKINSSNFWDDQKEATKVINEANILREDVSLYLDIRTNLDSLLELDEMAREDEEALALLEEEILTFDRSLKEAEEKALLSGKHDSLNAIVELHPGAGGTESMDWTLMLFRMYNRYCQKKGFKVDVLDYQPGDEAGIKSVTFLVKGRFAYGLFKAEMGVHRLVRISPFDAGARRHTSFCSCDVSPEIIDNGDFKIKDEEIRIDVFRSSGAGGQSVNTTDSAVRITHLPTNIVVSCQNERSQIKNREVAMKILRSKLIERENKLKEEELKKLKGNQMNIDFGSQIRSYVFCPYTLVKDHRTLVENNNVNAVMDGDIEEFMLAYLKYEKESESNA